MTKKEYHEFAKKHAKAELFKGGDTVRISDDLQKTMVGVTVNDQMLEYRGKQATINSVFGRSYNLKGIPWAWQDYMFELEQDPQREEIERMLV